MKIVRCDLSGMAADALVNSACGEVKVGAGVDSAIYAKGGKELWERRKAAGKREAYVSSASTNASDSSPAPVFTFAPASSAAGTTRSGSRNAFQEGPCECLQRRLGRGVKSGRGK